MRVREARIEDHDDVAAFTENTWPDRETGDYLGDVFPVWVESDDETRRTLVIEVDGGDESADADGPAVAGGSAAGSAGAASESDETKSAGEVVAVGRIALLSEYEAWAQGMRVHPGYRDEGLATRLTRAMFAWARERGASVCRNMIFSWNGPSLGLSRRVGFDPCTEFRWAHPTPDPDADPGLAIGGDPDAAWAFWTASDAAAHLRGLALDGGESWAVSVLTRERLRDAADDDRLLTIWGGGTRGFAVRNRTVEREADGAGGTATLAEYAVGAWDDVDAAAALFRAIERDAGDAGADETRVLIPESARWISDAAAARAEISDDPDFVMAADLTGDVDAR